jgi:hypothetical protein
MDQNVELKMHDGTVSRADMYRPDDGENTRLFFYVLITRYSAVTVI